MMTGMDPADVFVIISVRRQGNCSEIFSLLCPSIVSGINTLLHAKMYPQPSALRSPHGKLSEAYVSSFIPSGYKALITQILNCHLLSMVFALCDAEIIKTNFNNRNFA